jgi:hypothetical protein
MSSPSTLADRIARVADKVHRRRIRLGAPLSEQFLSVFEAQHEITLPQAYRAFLLHIGNGGQWPPDCGLIALGQPAADMPDVEAVLSSDLSRIHCPFPFTRLWVWEGGETSGEGTKEQIHDGCIRIGNSGCGMYWYVIVNGPERRNFWMISGDGMAPTTPRRDFLQWYEDWLDGVRDWWS